MILDFLIILTILFVTVVGLKKGLVNSILGFASALLSLPFAYFFVKFVPIDKVALKIAIFIVSLVVFRVLLYICGKALNVVKFIPLLKTANSLLGAVVGFLNGFITVSVICTFLMFCAYFRDGGVFGITLDYLQSSFFCRFLFSIIRFF